MPKKKGKGGNNNQAAAAAAPEPEAAPAQPAEAGGKQWEATRTDWKAGDEPSSNSPDSKKDLAEATKGVNVDATKDALSTQAQAFNSEASKESKVLEDKLGNLKEQLTGLRSAIVSFEQEFDARLDACMQQIMSHKIGSEDKSNKSSPVKAQA